MADNKNKQIPVSDSLLMRRNLLMAFVLLVFLLLLYVSVPGYNWAITEMAIRNKELIDKIEVRRLNNNMPELSMEDKRLFKIQNYWYIKFLRDHTPQDAVIILPPHTAIDTTEEYKLLNNSEYVEYFIFPRLCISEDEKNAKPELYKRATHVAILNGWGYDKLKYEPNGKPNETVLPIEPPKRDTTQRPDVKALKPLFLKDSVSNE